MRLWVGAAAASLLLLLLLLEAASAESDPVLVARAWAALRAVRGRWRRRRAALAAAAAACPRPRVFLGTPAKLKQFPNAVLAVVLFRACSGTIVDTRFVLLSSWCTAGRKQDGVVMAGNVNFNNFRDISYPVVQVRLIQCWWIYPWSSQQWNDITLVQLFTPFIFNSYVELDPMTDWSTFGNVTKTCMMAGFGEQFSWDVRHTLHYATVEVAEYHACGGNTVAFNAPIGENAICTTETTDRYTMCDGDAGGPLMCYGFLQGIISDVILEREEFIRNCSSPARCTYFMFVGYYRKWMMGIIRNSTKHVEAKCREEAEEGAVGGATAGAAGGEGPLPLPAPVAGLLLCLCSAALTK